MAIGSQRRVKWLAAGLLTLVFFFNYPLLRDAWRTPDHEGIGKPLAEIAQQLSALDIVIADHFRWGTPPALVYGKNVINGERFWNKQDKERIRRAVTLVQEHACNGHGVYFLTSTDRALDLYLDAIPVTDRVWTSEPSTTSRIKHRRNSRSFTAREHKVTFQLFKIRSQQRSQSH